MGTDHLGRAAARAREFIDIERGGIGREDAFGPGDAAQIGEVGFLEIHVLEHGLGDDIDFFETVISESGGDQSESALEFLGGHFAFGDRRLVILADC